MAKTNREVRYDRYGKFVFMAEADGYVMARRPRCMPHVYSRKKWDAMDREPWSDDKIAAFDAAERKKREQGEVLVRFLRTGQLPAS